MVSWTVGRSGPASPFGLNSSTSGRTEKQGENRYSHYIDALQWHFPRRRNRLCNGYGEPNCLWMSRHQRHALFNESFQQELAALYRPSKRGHPPIAPAQLALAIILQAYTGVSDAEVIEATFMDRRGPLVLDCLVTSQVLWSLGTFVAFRKRLIDTQMDRRLIERTIEQTLNTPFLDYGSYARPWIAVCCDVHQRSPVRSLDRQPDLAPTASLRSPCTLGKFFSYIDRINPKRNGTNSNDSDQPSRSL